MIEFDYHREPVRAEVVSPCVTAVGTARLENSQRRR